MLSLPLIIKDIFAKLNKKAEITYVDKKVADLVNGAPEQLDTLQELSKALNNDKDFATTMNNQLATKLDKAGGTITGTLTVKGKITGTATNADSTPWNGVTGKPTTYPPSGHSHSWDQTTGKPATFPPSGHTHVWANITDRPGSLPANGGTSAACSGNSATATTAAQLGKGGGTSGPMKFHWSGQEGQPSWLWGGNDGTNMYVYNPSKFSVNYANSAGSVAWNNVTGKPTSFAAAAHNHDGSYPSTTGARASGTWGINISGTAAAANSVAWGNVSGKPTTFTPSGHSHSWNDTTGKPANIVVVESWDAANGILKLKSV